MISICGGSLCTAASSVRHLGDKTDAAEEELLAEIKTHVFGAIIPSDEKGFVRLGVPKQDEWLSVYRETPQTFELYRLAARVRPTATRHTIVLQPLGRVDVSLLEAMREYAEIFFQFPARVAAPIELDGQDNSSLMRRLPAGHRHGVYDRQYNADKILTDVLEPHLPDDAIVCLGITMADIYSDDLNYVFGLGSLEQRVGVYSLCRYFPEFWGEKRKEGDDIIGLRRAFKVLSHETGHMFGLTHCVFYQCAMNGTNNLGETDKSPMEYCPLCHRKLLWNIGFDPEKRYVALEAFYRKNQLIEEADWMRKRIRNWKDVTEIEKGRHIKDE